MSPASPSRLSRTALLLGLLGLVAFAAAGLRLMVGGDGLAFPSEPIIWELRGRRLLIGAVVGASLGLSGVLLQGLLRNPLASPDLVGATSGASLGVMLSYWLGGIAGGGSIALLGEAGPALVGALLALAIVGLLGQRRGLMEPISLILVGVIVSLVCAAGVVLLQQQMPDRGFIAGRWSLGVLSDDTPSLHLLGAAGLLALALAWAVRAGPVMDAASMSDDEATSVGVRLGRLRAAQFALGGGLAAGSVVLAGPIGFVGLVCPHAVRLLIGPAHRSLAIGSAIAGATLVVLADALVKAIDLGGGRLPIGVLTTIIGGPVFIVMLRRTLRG